MSDPLRNPLDRQQSSSSLEQTLRMLNPPQEAPITIYPGPSSSNANLSKADLEIAQRLESLRKRSNENIPTEEEMASRLAQIKGLPADHYNRPQAAYQRPDTRTNVERSDDLLTQVMSEVAIDAAVPKPEDELEARLARLRGDEHHRGGSSAAPLGGAVARPPPTAANCIPRSYAAPSQSRMDNSIGDDLDDLTLDEVEAVMAAASQEATASAQQSMGHLEADRELAAAVAIAASNRDKKKKHRKHHKSGGDKHDTDSDDSIDLKIEGGKSLDAVKEQEEVQRIIDMYTKRAQKKKERKKKQKEAAAAAAAADGAVGGVVESDSDLEMSSLSDLSSESEKFSDSSDHISG